MALAPPVRSEQTAAPGDPAKAVCDYSDLTPSDLALRESLEYVDLSPHGAVKDCRNCSYWLPPKESACGGCTIMRGQVHPLGYCTSWEPV